jgi:hypothetical protein
MFSPPRTATETKPRKMIERTDIAFSTCASPSQNWK